MAASSDRPESLGNKTEQEWRGHIKGIIKGELKRQNLTYADLVKKLKVNGIDETEAGIRNKISRGSFSATFLFQCMGAIGVQLIPFRQDYSWNVTLSPELWEKLKS